MQLVMFDLFFLPIADAEGSSKFPDGHIPSGRQLRAMAL
jgi:hypothetical protein